MSRPAVKFGLGGRLTLLLALFGVLASGLTGYYAYSTSRELLVRAAEQRLLTATQVLVRQLVVNLEGAVRDVQLLANHPLPRQALAATSAAGRASAESGVDALFASLLATRPEYFQIRLIAAEEHGMERVRIDRDSQLLLQVAGDDLQEKGHYPYVFETLRLQPDKVYISSPAINHEEGAHAGLGRPSLHLAMAIHGSGRVLGLVVINIDLERIFKQLSADLPSEITFMLAGRHGDFLVHPDPAQAFAFDRGRRVLIHEQFPATAALLHGGSAELVTVSGGDGPAATVAAFVRYRLPAEHLERAFILGLAQPLSDVLADSDAVGRATARIVFAFSVLFVLLAVFLARAVIRPLNQMLRSVEHFAAGQTRTPLPVERRDEIGVLARSVDALQKQVAGQIAELHDKQLELDHLASHDSLTRLPNRRLFLDRLEHSLARVRRSGEPLSLLFIDLDQFKEINDRLGHAAGDIVLQAAADRMRGVVREVDTVARLGGDEFIILLDATDDSAVVANVADELLIALAQPVTLGAETLTIGGSIGISSYPRDGATATEIIAAADQAMYRAKNEGRNRFRFAGAGE